MYLKFVFYTILLTITLGACSSENDKRIQYALKRAGDNRVQLEQVLEHYKDSGLKYKAACYLIENMPYYYGYDGALIDSMKSTLAKALEFKNCILPDEFKNKWQAIDYRGQRKVYDVEVVRADYLIRHIDHAFRIWNRRPWSKDYSFEDFCEWVLPYRISDEPLEEWREEYYSYFADSVASLYKGGGMRGWINAVSDAVVSKFGYTTDFRLPHVGAKFLLHHRIGACRERNDFLVYVMRSLGMPVTIDKYYYSPSNQSSHTWNAVRDSIGGLIPVWDLFRLTESDGRKKGKV